jgi:acetylornithine deacetylase/succinyl-diaminopimelate desuccinylase-like protein
MMGVPTIGFGPASERHAHAPDDQCPVNHLGQAIAFYAILAAMFAGEVN